MDKTGHILFKIIVLYIVFPVVLFFIPLSSLYNLPSICLYKNLFGIECPGCGMTRAVLSIIHLKFSEALTYNRLVIVVFPLMAYMFFKNLFRDIKRMKTKISVVLHPIQNQ
ncbi:MAG: DUF2752 domain-containing protein [Candidatus Ratteibacteria bacterium]|nr:DUF2752 domain-containing protein [Candidatus Ratteibacteria bacterium]